MARHAFALALLATLAGATHGESPDPEAAITPRRTGLVEEVGRELVQLARIIRES